MVFIELTAEAVAGYLRCEYEDCDEGWVHIKRCNCGGRCPCDTLDVPHRGCQGTGIRTCEADGCDERASDIRQEMDGGRLVTYALCRADAEIFDLCVRLRALPEESRRHGVGGEVPGSARQIGLRIAR